MNGRTEARIMSDLDEAVDYTRKPAGDSVIRETPDIRISKVIGVAYRPDLSEGDPGSRRLPEGRLVERAQLPRVQCIPACTRQTLKRLNTDADVFADGPLVEAVSRSRELDLAM